MSIPQARMLARRFPRMDGHAQAARAVCETLIGVAEAAGLVKRGPAPNAPLNTAPAAPDLSPSEVLIPELETIIEARVQARLAAASDSV